MTVRRATALALLVITVVSSGAWLIFAAEVRVAANPAPIAAPSAPATSSSPTAASPTFPAPTAPSPSPRPIPEGYRVQVPRLRIDLPIREGDITQDVVNQQTPEHAAFHFPGTHLPGDGNNSFIYAHARTGMFLTLWNAREGDELTIVAPDGVQLRYVVSQVHPRVPPTEIKWLEPTASERITLQTSTGPNPDDPRFIVVAVPK